MFMSENPQQESAIDFYTPAANRREQPHQSSSNNMLIHLTPHPHHLPAASSSSGDDTSANHNSSHPPSLFGPKKRADTWAQDETRALISLRKEVHTMFNTSKSNKHLWDSISIKMRDRGFDRSPAMCTDKWRNLLKKFKKSKHSSPDGVNGSGKMRFFKEIVEVLGEGNANGPGRKISDILNNDAGAGASKVDSFMQFADKGIDDASLPLGHVEANGRSTLNLETHLDHDGLPLSIAPTDAIGANGVSPWNWRETPGSGEQTNNMAGRVITVKLGDYTKKIGIDASANSIKEAIKSAFRLRTQRAFWLEDEDNVVRSLGKDMPLGNYTLHVDEGLTIKVCVYGETDALPVHTESRTFYSDEDFRHFLKSRGWISLREYNGFRSIDSMDELCPGAIYRGVS